MALQVSSDSEAIIHRQLNLSQVNILKNLAEIEEFYEIEKCVKWIQQIKRKKVTLQFPDHMLVDSPEIALQLQNRTDATVYILGDTSYGSCCVDEIAAEHVKADSLIHFGHACLSPTRRIPVLYVFGKPKVDVQHLCDTFTSLIENKEAKIMLLYDTVYTHSVGKVYNKLKETYPNLVFSTLDEDILRDNAQLSYNDACESKRSCCACSNTAESEENSCSNPAQPQTAHNAGCCCNNIAETSAASAESECACRASDVRTAVTVDLASTETENEQLSVKKLGRIIRVKESDLESYSMFFVGNEDSCLLTFMMTFSKSSFYTYNPETKIGQRETLGVNKMLMKRYYLIEKSRDANLVGIVVGTLGVANYLSIISRLKELAKSANKKAYVISVGKINPAKLANFPDIDVFVLVACPENSLITDTKSFYQSIVTPFEFEIACNQARSWTGDFVTDFRSLLPGADAYVAIGKSHDDDDDGYYARTDVSLISGKIRSTHVSDAVEEEADAAGSMTLDKRNDQLHLAPLHRNAAGETFSNRSWTGLEQKLGETSVTKAVEGRKGLAWSYSNEKEHFDS